MGRLCELLDVQHRQRRIGDRFPEYGFRVLLKCRVQLLLGTVRIHEGYIYAHFLHGYRNQVIGSAVNAGRSHNVAACLADIKQGKEIRGLSG